MTGAGPRCRSPSRWDAADQVSGVSVNSSANAELGPMKRKDLGANVDVGDYAHWGNWVDQCLGDKSKEVCSPFQAGLRMTECAILPVKASRFPGQELKWDKKSLTFTNS